MKSATFIGTAHPYRGGLTSFNQMLARMFRRKGVDARIHTFTVQYPSFLFPGKSQYSDSPAPGDLEILRTVNTVNPLNWFRIGRRLRPQ